MTYHDATLDLGHDAKHRMRGTKVFDQERLSGRRAVVRRREVEEGEVQTIDELPDEEFRRNESSHHDYS